MFPFCPGIWRYRIERLGDSHQSHFVQVVTSTTAAGASDEFSVRLFSNVEETRVVNLGQMPLILYAEVKKGVSPVLDADVEATIVAGTLKWNVRLFDGGNGGMLTTLLNCPVTFCCKRSHIRFLFKFENRSWYHWRGWGLLTLHNSTLFHSNYNSGSHCKSKNISVSHQVCWNGLDYRWKWPVVRRCSIILLVLPIHVRRKATERGGAVLWQPHDSRLDPAQNYVVQWASGGLVFGED